MKIAFSGTQNTGKTTLIPHFLKRWPMYKTPNGSYRDVIVENKLEHSSKTGQKTQWLILEWMVDLLQKCNSDDKLIFDRCPLDNLAYSFWSYGKGVGDIDTAFMDKTIAIVKESLKYLNIIFWIPYNNSIPIKDDGLRDTNLTHIQEINNIFESLYDQYQQNLHANVFFPKDDCPAIIKLEGTTIDQRLDYIGEYLNPEGEIFGDDHSIFNPQHISELEQLVNQQRTLLAEEQREKELYRKFGLK